MTIEELAKDMMDDLLALDKGTGLIIDDLDGMIDYVKELIAEGEA